MDEIKTISVDEEVFCLMAGKAIRAVAEKRFGKDSLTGSMMIAVMSDAASKMWQMLKELDAENKLLEEDEQTAGKQDQLKKMIMTRIMKLCRAAYHAVRTTTVRNTAFRRMMVYGTAVQTGNIQI